MATRMMVMAGGTGGHVYPALAVAQELRQRGWDISWLGTPNSFESKVVPQYGFDIDWVDAYRLRGQGVVGLALAPIRLVRAMWQAAAVIRRRRPEIVLGMGGFVTGPGGLVARLFGLPLVIHEQNAIPGLTNRWLARIAGTVLQAFPESFPDNSHVTTTGNPVRKEIAGLAEPAVRMGAHLGPCHLLIIGGSLGAEALNKVVPAALGMLTEQTRPVVRHQAGRDKAVSTGHHYDEADVVADISDFIDDMAAAYDWADLVICRAGASTVTELMAAGVASILVPYPHAVDDHQTRNAGYLVNTGAGRLIPQSDLYATILSGHLRQLCQDRTLLLEMANAARTQARPDSTERVADLCEEALAA